MMIMMTSDALHVNFNRSKHRVKTMSTVSFSNIFQRFKILEKNSVFGLICLDNR